MKVITSQRYQRVSTYEEYLARCQITANVIESMIWPLIYLGKIALSFKDNNNLLGGIKVLAIVEDWCRMPIGDYRVDGQNCPIERDGTQSVLSGQETLISWTFT